MSEDRNYVAAWVDWNTDKIVVIERDTEGKTFRKRYNPPYYFYIPAESEAEAEYTSIFGDALVRAEFETRDEYEYAKKTFKNRFESDITPLKRVLMDTYYNRKSPIVNYAFFDIEVDYAQKIGFAGPKNPYAPINAVTTYQSWTGKYITRIVAPEGCRVFQANIISKIEELIKAGNLRDGIIPEIIFCADELELLTGFFDDIEAADIISGWNSEFFDVPYIAERAQLAGGQALLARLEHIGVGCPKKEMVNRFGTEEPIYKFRGRSHLDYMRLFKKFTFEGRVSYSLGNILDEEVGVGKLEYDGTLEELYYNDFATFVAYNFRDVDGIVQLNEKFKFIALANQIAHENTVLFDAVLGTVSYVETGITNHAHYVLNKIVHDKIITEHDKVEGAIVLTPTPGLYEYIGSVDINSLYPNIIRSLNISPEMIVGQFTAQEEAWNDIRAGNDKRLTLILESSEQHVASAAEWKAVLQEQKWAVSAFGTVFDQGRGKGVVADILGFWYAERKRLQAEQKKYEGLAKKEQDPVKKKELERTAEHYDLLQLTKKIAMNSLYGALLNVAFRFGDERMGASVTASGRATTTHMLYKIEEVVTGIPKAYQKVKGLVKKAGNHDDFGAWHYITQRKQMEVLRREKKLFYPNQQLPDDFVDFDAVIYGDTDSCYFNTLTKNPKDAIEAADLIADAVNESFPIFMREAFNCQPEFDGLIKAGREIVGVRGLFQAKKKYIVKIIDKEGSPPKPGKDLKTQGSEIKKADTPKVIQKFLKKTVDMILEGQSYGEVEAFVNSQRKEVLRKVDNVFALGVAKQVNNLDKYTAEYLHPGTQRSESGGKLTITGHARAACNYNHLLGIYDKGAKEIQSGDKILVYYLKPNQFNFKSIAFPAEFSRFPKWFDEHFKVDRVKTEDKMFDSKLEGMFGAWGYEVPTPQTALTNSLLEF
jgi:DNA polymerase elongation subunit (family B)